MGDMLNVKTMVYGKRGYADMDAASRPAYQALEARDPCYKRNTARDFFNYFGARDGDDGLPWRDVGGGVRKCSIQDFELTSMLVLQHRGGAQPECDQHKNVGSVTIDACQGGSEPLGGHRSWDRPREFFCFHTLRG